MTVSIEDAACFDVKLLRRQLRQRRRALSYEQQQHHARCAVREVLRSRVLQRAWRIALFLSQDGELDTQGLIQALWRRRRQLWLPVIQRGGRMRFAQYQPHSPMSVNRFGIAEPRAALKALAQPQYFDVVFVPLVGFDGQGHRLGMGGGFYDRSFAFRRQVSHRPLLIGWAHSCQQVDALPFQPWDVNLDAVVTEQGLRWF
ncbi:MAG: 5-formyltetrahydrofolate cyclo-ligase [Thiomicrospira sp.]